MGKKLVFPLACILALLIVVFAATAGERRELAIVFANDVRGETEPCG